MQPIKYIFERIAEKQKMGKTLFIDVFTGNVANPETAPLFVRLEGLQIEEQINSMIMSNPQRMFTLFIRLKNVPIKSSERLVYTPEHTPINGLAFTDQSAINIEAQVEERVKVFLEKKALEDKLLALETKIAEDSIPNKMLFDLLEKVVLGFQKKASQPAIQGYLTKQEENMDLELKDETFVAVQQLIELFTEPGLVKLVVFLKNNPEYVTLVKSKI